MCLFWGAGCRSSSYTGDLLLRISTKCRRTAKKKKKKNASLQKASFWDWCTVSSTCMPLAKANHRARANPGAGPHTSPMEVIGMNNLNNILTTHPLFFSQVLYEILYPQWQNTSKSVSRWTEFGQFMHCLRYIFWPFNQLGFRILLPHLWLRNQCCGMFCLPGLTELRHPLMESWIIFLRAIHVPIWPMVWIRIRMDHIGSPVHGQQKNFSGSPSNSRDNIMCLLAPDTLVQWKYSYLLDRIAQIPDTTVEDEPCVWILELFMIRIPHHDSSELIKATQSQPCREKGK